MSIELILQNMEHLLATYIRTKTVFKNRLKHLKDYDTVKIYNYELDKLDADSGPLLCDLKVRGEILVDGKGDFKALRKGPIDPSLLGRTRKRDGIRAPLTLLHKWMRKQLLHVELDAPLKDMPVHFSAFLDHRKDQLDSFFTVDSFSGRVHSPVVNLKGNLRESLRFHGEQVVSLDVKQTQPTILASKILKDTVGSNPFSDAIFWGEDVHVVLQKAAGLNSWEDAKRLLFQLIFGKPMNDVGRLFKGDTAWVDWVNSHKSQIEHRNPHKQEVHANLAWLLQHSEVQVVLCIWNKLKAAGIPFLTIHDDVLCPVRHKDAVYEIMDRELMLHFPKHTVVADHHKSDG